MKELFIFTHIPKTAGMSMHELLKKQFAEDEIRECFFHGSVEVASLPQIEKDKLKLLRGHVPYGLHKHFPNRRCRYITMMREPVNRVVSLYYYIKERPSHEFYNNMKDLNLIEFCEKFETETSNMQSFFLVSKRNPSANEVKLALANIFEFSGVTEMFNESAMIIKHQFGWDDCSYNIVNVTEKRRKIDELTNEETNYIIGKNQIDLEVYNWLRNKVQQQYNEILSKKLLFR